MASKQQDDGTRSFVRGPGSSTKVVAGLLRISTVAALFLVTFLSVPARANVAPNGEVAGLKAKFTDVNGLRMRYYEMGQGEPMVLVHGEGWSGHSSANFWSKNIPGLAKRFHVYALDRVGSGMSDNPKKDTDYTLQGDMEYLYQFIQALKLGPVHLVGQSHGGGLAFFLSVEHPEIVRTVIIVDTSTAAPETPPYRPDPLAKCPKQPEFDFWKCRVQALANPGTFDDEFFEAAKYMASLPKSAEAGAKAKAAEKLPLNMEFNDWRKLVHDNVKLSGFLPMPVLVYWGRNDMSAPIERGKQLFDIIAAQNTKAKMFVVNKGGHYSFREYPEEFNNNVIHYIDSVEHPAEPTMTAAKQPAGAPSPNGEINGLKASFVDVNGVRTRYYEMGQGEPMVLLHGGGFSGSSSANAWSRNVAGLAAHYLVFAIDKLASGLTDNPKDDKNYNIQGEIDHMYGFIQTLKLGKVHVVGQSRGSELALFFAVEHPDTVRTIVLCDTSAALPPAPFTRPMALAHCSGESRQGQDNGNCGENAQTFTYAQSNDRAFVDATFGDEFWASANYMRGLPKSQVTAAKMKAGAGAPLAEDGNEIVQWKTEMVNRIKNEAILQMPILIYWGRNDPVANWSLGWQLYDSIAQKDAKVRLLTVNKAGHFHFREYPEDFNSNVFTFIDYWDHQSESVMSLAQPK